MVDAVVSPSASKNKLRYMRLKETKRKLYEASCKEDSLSMIYSQLAMLTYSVDSLTSYIAGAATMCNPRIFMAPSFEHRGFSLM